MSGWSGVTEPDAGLDTTSIKTFATKVDGGYRVTGRKIWTSSGHVANKILLAHTHHSEGSVQEADGRHDAVLHGSRQVPD